MSKKRLYRSSDAVISGVCGGIAEYCGIDSTLVRIIAVALAIVLLGAPVIFYIVLMVALPPDPGIAQGYVDARAEATKKQEQRTCSPRDSSSTDQPPPPNPTARVSSPSAYAYEEAVPEAAGPAVAGVEVPGPGPAVSSSGSIPRVASAAKNHSSAVLVVGAVLIGIGVIALLCNIVHVSVWRFWPVVIIVVGVVCLFTPGSHAWSLERAGNAIVLITVGLALLAWMLQIVQARAFIAAFWDLWPMLLVVLGLSIIGSARKSSGVALISSLLLSATIIVALWFYGGLNWESISGTLLLESDGLQEFLSDISFGR